MADRKKKKNFEETLNGLEEIVSELESGNLSLEESLKKFEDGTLLYKDCKDWLNKAEKKINILTETLKEEEFQGK